MKSENKSFLSAAVDAWQEGKEEARRERAARQLGYHSELVESFNYSPKEFYVLLAKNLEKRQIPGMEAEVVALRESIIGSPNRLYLAVGRERFIYYTCAAPFGTGFFFSWRFVDERRPAKWSDFVVAAALLAFSSLVSGTLFGRFGNVNAVGLEAVSLFAASATGLILLGAIWTAMRLAALPGYETLALVVEKQPFFGRIFERLYRPDTYYRQDTAEMYKKAFNYALQETIDAVKTPHGVRNSGLLDSSAVVHNLHRR